jgi:hypothetical protein
MKYLVSSLVLMGLMLPLVSDARAQTKEITLLSPNPIEATINNPGLDVVGALSPDASTPVDITGFLSTGVNDPKAARALLDYLSSREVAPVYESAKIFPVR